MEMTEIGFAASAESGFKSLNLNLLSKIVIAKIILDLGYKLLFNKRV